MIVTKTKLKSIPDKCNKCKFSYTERGYRTIMEYDRYCTQSKDKYGYDMRIPYNKGYIRPNWCPLMEI
jgi:hypothetical protein